SGERPESPQHQQRRNDSPQRPWLPVQPDLSLPPPVPHTLQHDRSNLPTPEPHQVRSLTRKPLRRRGSRQNAQAAQSSSARQPLPLPPSTCEPVPQSDPPAHRNRHPQPPERQY